MQQGIEIHLPVTGTVRMVRMVPYHLNNMSHNQRTAGTGTTTVYHLPEQS
jgi:hypothetical protein